MKNKFPHQSPQQSTFTLKLIISGVCLLILIVLYALDNRSIAVAFQDLKSHLPSLPKISFSLPQRSEPAKTDPVASAPVSSDTSAIADTSDSSDETQKAAILFDTDTLVYDPSEDLNLMDGVQVVDETGSQLEDVEVTTSVSEGESKEEKRITYTAEVNGTELSAVRTLTLEGYEGPSIQIEDTLEGLTSDNQEEILSEWIASGALSAENGLGDDCSDDITETHEPDEEDPLLYHYTFSVENQLGDQATQEAEVQLTLTKPLIVLNTKEVTLQVGEPFDYGQYITTCMDEEGNSLSDYIVLSDRPNTDEPGTYEVEYTVYNEDGVFSDPATLKVIVEESEDGEDTEEYTEEYEE